MQNEVVVQMIIPVAMAALGFAVGFFGQEAIKAEMQAKIKGLEGDVGRANKVRDHWHQMWERTHNAKIYLERAAAKVKVVVNDKRLPALDHLRQVAGEMQRMDQIAVKKIEEVLHGRGE